ncbi:hypothetical protein V8G54_015114 [Vigna mungo]|uniref:Uncharacterized protein n=1 Tax=Vigna mungo TaxID=3915 RepID=A0AAQ3RWK3_VIGMU
MQSSFFVRNDSGSFFDASRVSTFLKAPFLNLFLSSVTTASINSIRLISDINTSAFSLANADSASAFCLPISVASRATSICFKRAVISPSFCVLQMTSFCKAANLTGKSSKHVTPGMSVSIILHDDI